METVLELLTLALTRYPHLVTWVLAVLLAVALIVLAVGREVTIGPIRIGPPTTRRGRGQSKTDPEARRGPLVVEGRRLFEYKGCYPVDITPITNKPTLNPDVFVRAMRFFTSDKCDRRAAMDLVYLREHNLHIFDVLPLDETDLYERLIHKYHLEEFRRHVDLDDERLFANYKRLVRDLGRTLKGTCVEIVLHNVRNPLRSIVAAEGTDGISNRRVDDPSTRFVVQYVKNQGKALYEALDSDSEVAYLKQFTRDKKVKATTIPIYDPALGLIGLLCINIDIDQIAALSPKGKQKLIEAFVQHSGHTPAIEQEVWRLAGETTPGESSAPPDAPPIGGPEGPAPVPA